MGEMSALASDGILSLPDEILLILLRYIPPATVLSLSRTSRRFYIVTASPLLWQYYCKTEFQHWDKRHNFETRLSDKSFAEWKELFIARYQASILTRGAFDRMLDEETNRLDHINGILSVGYDAKDVLLDAYENAEGNDRHLAQRLLFSLMIRNLH